MQIYIHRGNEDFGPYSREAVLEYVRQGVFDAVDYACYAGMSEWKTIGDLLGIEESKGAKGAKGSRTKSVTKITEFSPDWTQTSTKKARTGGGGIKRWGMAILNLVLISIVAMVVYVRLGGGRPIAHRYFGALSAELAKLANETQGSGPAAEPASSPGEPVIEKVTVGPVGPGSVAPSGIVPQVAPQEGGVAKTSIAASSPATSGTGAAEEIAVPKPGIAMIAASPAAAMITPVVTGSATTSVAGSSPAAGVAQMAAPAVSSTAAGSAPAAAGSSPALVVASASAAPAPVVPPAPPKPFDPADIAGNPGAWPKTLRLKEAVDFPVLFQGQVAGSVTVPAGTVVNLVNIQGDQLILGYGGGTQKLFWRQTDLEEQMVRSSGAAAPPAAPGGPATVAPAAAATPDAGAGSSPDAPAGG